VVPDVLAPVAGGIFIGVFSALPIVSLGNCCCMWIIGGGFLAAYVQQQNDPRPFTMSRGAMVGLGAGLVGAVVWLVVSLAVDVVLAPLQQRVLGEIVRTARDMPPEARAFLRSMAEGGSPFRYVFGFALMLFLGAPFATLGGVLGAAFFRPDVPPALGGPIAPPPPPSLS
jgi:hypothetical protein